MCQKVKTVFRFWQPEKGEMALIYKEKPAISTIAGFCFDGRSVGIRTRGLLVPKVGRIFLADISRHFCVFPLGKFHSGILSGTDKSTAF